MFRVVYEKIEGSSDYVVRCLVLEMEVVVSLTQLMQLIDVHPRALIGCQDVGIYEILELGFVFPVKKRTS